MQCKKSKTGQNLEHVDMNVPNSYMDNYGDILASDRGQYKLRMRNDSIYGDLSDMAKARNTKVVIGKHGNRIYYTVVGMGITVSLISS